MTKYTVRQATATGKDDATYGKEYIVHFEEDEREVKLSRKNPVEPGQIENGQIINGKYGAYFKKDPYNPNAPKTNSNPKTQSSPAPKYVPYKKTDNSDGMRQGMCFNNAANYVNTNSPELVDAETWAKTVYKYANALYNLGNLGVVEQAENVAGLYDN